MEIVLDNELDFDVEQVLGHMKWKDWEDFERRVGAVAMEFNSRKLLKSVQAMRADDA